MRASRSQMTRIFSLEEPVQGRNPFPASPRPRLLRSEPKRRPMTGYSILGCSSTHCLSAAFCAASGVGATTDSVAVLIPNFRHIGAPPKFHLFGPSAVYARSLDMPLHHKGNSDEVM